MFLDTISQLCQREYSATMGTVEGGQCFLKVAEFPKLEINY